MPTSYRAAHLRIARRLETELAGLFVDVAARAQQAILRHADAEGHVPRGVTVEIQQEIDRAVVAMFLGRNGRGELAPFDVLPNGMLVPLSPYTRVLWASIRATVRNQVEREAALMRRRLPPDILAWLGRATRAPFQSSIASEVFQPNPLAKYDAPHTWVDPNGYRLSDRIWNTSQHTRRRIDMYLDEAIREGRSATVMARELEQFLVPGRELLRTNRPYGRDASYDAMRLARTENARAGRQASEQSARLNPLVAGLKWNRSPQGQPCDICDPLASGGPNGDGVYPIDQFPQNSHPNCLCYATQELLPAAELDAQFERLRADVQSARAELIALVGPLLVERFTDMLLGRHFDVMGAQPSLAGVFA